MLKKSNRITNSRESNNTMKRKTLLSFIPPFYSTAKTGRAIITKPARDEGSVEPLPEMQGGEVLLNPRSGKTYRVHVVRKPKRETGFEERLYRLENVVIGNQEWTGDELAAAGMRLENV